MSASASKPVVGVARPRTRYPVGQGKFLNATLPALRLSRMVDRMVDKQLGLLPRPVANR